jgi:protein-S-isoprenylcysteine O-methyltransferase Ste14
VTRGFPDLPPVWAAGMAAAGWVLARTVPLAPLPAPPGWGLVAAGVALILWAAAWFRARRTTIEPHRTPTALIVEGPFRFNRNPIYTGMTLILLGWAFLLGAASALVPAAVFALLVTRRFIVGEEAALRLAFGPEAARYLAATRRW